MKFRAALVLLTTAVSAEAERKLAVGDEVCITGPIMDNWCIYDTGGEYPDKVNLDNPSVVTLKNPELHTIHCLLDVPACEKSGFQVLGPKNPDTGYHCPGFRLDDTAAVLAAGRAIGSKPGGCTTCTNEATDGPTKGLELTVKGKISSLGDGSDDTAAGVAVMTVTEVLDPETKCDGPDTVPPHSMCMTSDAPSNSTEPEPANPIEPEPANSTEPAPANSTEPAPAPTPPGDSDPAPSGAWQVSAAPAWLGALVASALAAV